ncbi:MAG: bifunctional response regulator/alkaline phosphatase family protein [Bacteroidaceae bacterium]|nr:bifunctional response regulator/alkaline phosphatase family protein [Bacteroidaceae bacterium]
MEYRLLWADDEIELLKAHILFLEKKGYAVDTVTNGYDALDKCSEQGYDLILLDENMPGLTGLETLTRIKDMAPSTPVVMVTKSEEENIMEQAIGSKIADYLIKPVNPTQILLTLKKNIHRREIVAEVTQSAYQQDFSKLLMQMGDASSIEEWKDVYKRLTYWDLQLTETDSSMKEMLAQQHKEANHEFARFVRKHYLGWVQDAEQRPTMSPDIFKKYVFPALKQEEKVFLIVMDNFRYDQWRTIYPELAELFTIEEDLYCGILPTATQYARNAIFSGLMPVDIEKMFPQLWVDEDSEEGKNLNEAPLIQTQLERFRRHNTFSYHKVNDSHAAEKLVQQLPSLQHYDLNVVVLNFIDMLSHARTESRMVRELASDEAAYRSITLSWFRHSPASEMFRALATSDYKIVITTDHGSIRAYNPIKVVGEKNTNTNLRYKLGRNLSYNPKEVFEIKDPRRAGLPSPNISTTYIFATEEDFFAYPNNYNHYVQYYKDTFQHGGVSMEEMLIPIITMRGKKR